MEKVWKRAMDELEWYRSKGKTSKKEVQYTGYYLPSMNGQRKKDAVFNYPFYKIPKDLKKGAKKFSRYEIDFNDSLKNQGLEKAVFVLGHREDLRGRGPHGIRRDHAYGPLCSCALKDTRAISK